MADTANDASNLVVARTFTSPHEANLAWSVLDAAGLAARIADEHTVRADWFLSNAVGGVKIMVRAEDLETARELLDLAAVVSDEDASSQMLDTGDSEEDACPSCGGRAWESVAHGKRLAILSMLIMPLLLPIRRRWRCGQCGYEVK